MVVTSAPYLQSNKFRFSRQHLDSGVYGVRGCGGCATGLRTQRRRRRASSAYAINTGMLVLQVRGLVHALRASLFVRIVAVPVSEPEPLLAGLGPARDGGHLPKRLRHQGRLFGAGSIPWVWRTTTRSSPICMAWACITWSWAVILASSAVTSFSSLSVALVGISGTKTRHEPFTFSPANAPAFSLRRIVSGETSNCALAWRMLKPDSCMVPTSSLSVATAILGKLLDPCLIRVVQGLGSLLIVHRAWLAVLPW